MIHVMQPSWRVDLRPLLFVLALICAAALAEEVREPALPSGYMDRIREQIYEDASDWRSTEELTESSWRRTPIVEEKRPRFGYDAEFNERLHRGELDNYDSQHRLGEPEPNTVFRIDLK